jgi:hypothetical protein
MNIPKKLPLQDNQENPIQNENEITPNVTDRTAPTEDSSPTNLTNPGGTGSVSVRN